MATEIGNFTNDSAMMLAYERALETSRPDALFQDRFATVLAGHKGKELSDMFGSCCSSFDFGDWPEFHKVWAAVRTKFIDDTIAKHAASGKFPQLVNLGAGFDTRPYRLECYQAFTHGSFEVDMETINANKAKVLEEFLGQPPPHCSQVRSVNLDLLDGEATLSAELQKASFDAAQPAIFLAEGLVQYLGDEGRWKLVRDVSAAAAPGSVLVLQFLDASESAAAAAMGAGMSAAEAAAALEGRGWEQLEFARFGDERLSFGRFPAERFRPSALFSFVVCVKSAPAP
mmetsp:Transcript_64892/g.156852  ORF Transcript_64892/g.156852 Transcript_64892/m.156852 type:complete len:286 (+) Transcript_64892:72-929(+)